MCDLNMCCLTGLTCLPCAHPSHWIPTKARIPNPTRAHRGYFQSVSAETMPTESAVCTTWWSVSARNSCSFRCPTAVPFAALRFCSFDCVVVLCLLFADHSAGLIAGPEVDLHLMPSHRVEITNLVRHCPLPCVSTAVAAKTVPFLAVIRSHTRQLPAAIRNVVTRVTP